MNRERFVREGRERTDLEGEAWETTKEQSLEEYGHLSEPDERSERRTESD